jgi:hypothetical protein
VTWGDDMLDYVYLQMAGTPRDTLYEHQAPWDTSDLVAYFNSNTMNVVNHMGHANESYVMKMGQSDAVGLTNTNPFFVYSQGCYAGAFDIADSMAEQFTSGAEVPRGDHDSLWWYAGLGLRLLDLFQRSSCRRSTRARHPWGRPTAAKRPRRPGRVTAACAGRL